MMRIKEAIQRRRMIQEMTDGWNAWEGELAESASPPGVSTFTKSSFIENRKLASIPSNEDDQQAAITNSSEIALQQFANHLKSRMNTFQNRALRITWKRLSEAPRTSGRGNINIMEKVFEKMVENCADVMPIFYRSAFLSCVEDKKRNKNTTHPERTIATIRDHAHLLVDFIDDIICAVSDKPLKHGHLDPYSIGNASLESCTVLLTDMMSFDQIQMLSARIHSRLEPLGFQRNFWDFFGEVLAEVMFSQECVRAYPHAGSAWSLLSLMLSDSFHNASKKPKFQPSPSIQVGSIRYKCFGWYLAQVLVHLVHMRKRLQSQFHEV
ncbi:unnamed protein product [Anisakis simplex]|uniref:GLOBIN domain-containing protein n=1 Tax=Anisakis simplex TaxID=6269 RepID=A0A0M3J1Z7_ANISI|nr:unnamed protein product [Anisakis simplex]